MLQRLSKILKIPYNSRFVLAAPFFALNSVTIMPFIVVQSEKVKIMVFRLIFGELTT